MANSMRLLSFIKPENAHRSESESTRKFRQESGLTMAFFISSILGENAINTDFRYYHGRTDPGPMRPR